MNSLRPLREKQQAAIGQWKPVVGFEGEYEVSEHGAVRSLRRAIIKHHLGTPYQYTVPERLLSVGLWNGYPSVALRSRRCHVHRLVAHAFIGGQPPGMIVCHRDGNRLNSHFSNLRYDTPAGNSADMREHGTLLLGRMNHLAKLDEDSVRFIRAMRGRLTQRALAQMYGVTHTAIGYVQRGQMWSHIGGGA